MSDLETRLRRGLDEHAAAFDVTTQPPAGLLARVDRSRRRRRLARVVTPVLVAAGLLGLVPVLNGGDEVVDVATGRRTPGPPPGPPVLTGTIVARVATSPCDRRPGNECVSGPFQFDIRSPATLQPLDPQAFELLGDGRFATRQDGSWSWVLVDPAGGTPLPLGRDVDSIDVLPDGRLLMLATNGDGRRVIRKVDPSNGAVQDRALPSGVKIAAAVTAGPDGTIAVLGATQGCCDPTDLFLVRPDGKETRHRLDLPAGQQSTFGGGPARLSWGPTGLIAISANDPHPLADAFYEGRRSPERNVPHPGWTHVVDPATGDLVASLDGWEGLAWSPDGRGLLAARRAGIRQSELAVWWGPGLKERINVGRTPLPVLPRLWTT